MAARFYFEAEKCTVAKAPKSRHVGIPTDRGHPHLLQWFGSEILVGASWLLTSELVSRRPDSRKWIGRCRESKLRLPPRTVSVSLTRPSEVY